MRTPASGRIGSELTRSSYQAPPESPRDGNLGQFRRAPGATSLIAAASMVSSDSRTCSAASPSGMKLSLPATRSKWAREAMLDQRGQHALADPPVSRVSSTISTRPWLRLPEACPRPVTAPATAGRRRAHWMSADASLRATRRLMRSPLPNVRIVRSAPSPYVRARPIATPDSGYGASQPPSLSSYRSRV